LPPPTNNSFANPPFTHVKSPVRHFAACFNTTGVIETPIFMHIEGKPYGNTEEGHSTRLVPPDGIDPAL
jgi:hypothetical protein